MGDSDNIDAQCPAIGKEDDATEMKTSLREVSQKA